MADFLSPPPLSFRKYTEILENLNLESNKTLNLFFPKLLCTSISLGAVIGLREMKNLSDYYLMHHFVSMTMAIARNYTQEISRK